MRLKKITIITSEKLAKLLFSALDLHILQMCLLKFSFWYFPLTRYVKHIHLHEELVQLIINELPTVSERA